MNVIYKNHDMSKRDIVSLTRSATESIDKVTPGTIIHPDNVLQYTDISRRVDKATGEAHEEEVTVLVIEDTAADRKFSTTSPYFMDEFMYIADFMGDDDFSIKTTRNTSKNNREFNSCEIV